MLAISVSVFCILRDIVFFGADSPFGNIFVDGRLCCVHNVFWLIQAECAFVTYRGHTPRHVLDLKYKCVFKYLASLVLTDENDLPFSYHGANDHMCAPRYHFIIYIIIVPILMKFNRSHAYCSPTGVEQPKSSVNV